MANYSPSQPGAALAVARRFLDGWEAERDDFGRLRWVTPLGDEDDMSSAEAALIAWLTAGDDG